jgi:O-antigen/teichoic acid export membrane protein
MKIKHHLSTISNRIKPHTNLRNFAAPILFLFAGGSNFCFQVFMARSLQPEDFGVFENYWSIISNLGLLFSGTQIFAAYSMFAIKPTSKSEIRQRKYFDKYLKSTMVVALISTLILLALITFGSSRRLTILPAVVIFMSIPASILGNIMLGKVQGSSHPTELQVWSFIMSFSKVIIAIIILEFTSNVFVVIIALIFKQSIFALILTVRSKNLGDISVSFFNQKSLQMNLHYILFWLVAGFDVSLYGRTSSDLELGNYAAAANIGKIILFFAIMIPTIMFRFILNEKIVKKAQIRMNLAGLFLLVSLVILIIILILLREWLFGTIYGSSYSRAADIFIPYSLAMLPVSLYFYELTFKFVDLKTRSSILLLLIGLTQLGGMAFLDLSTEGFLGVIGLGSLTSFLVLKLIK